MSRYEGVDPTYEYIKLLRDSNGLDTLIEFLECLETDDMVKHVDISQYLSIEEADNPEQMSKFTDRFKKALSKNKCLTALDIAGNYLGQATPHPNNNHKIDYLSTVAIALSKSSVLHLDVSGSLKFWLSKSLTNNKFYCFQQIIEYLEVPEEYIQHYQDWQDFI